MTVKDVADLSHITAADASRLREIFHPERDGVAVGYSLAIAAVAPGERTLQHRLASSEIYYLLSGTGRMHVDEEVERVHAGNCIYVPPGSVQWIENTGRIDLAFLCIVDPAWRPQDEEVIPA
jgi:mannose-6-phosphate isomerase-like protein (cupin superfamily)